MTTQTDLWRVLVVDDDEDDRFLVEDLLRGVTWREIRVRGAATAGEGLDVLRSGWPDVALVDYRLGSESGLDLVREARTAGVETPILLLTGQDSREVDLAALATGAQDYLVKSDLSASALERSLRYALERQAHLEAMRQREEELFQAQKMEAMGRLAGGVAHDFNNLLTAIGGYAELLLAGLEDEGQRADCQEILRASERAAELTRQLLSFSRREELRPGRLDLDRVIGETERLLRRVIPADIRLDLELAGDLPEVLADAGRLEQVLVNLVVNARDAMQGRGRITISTGLREPDEAAGAEAWVCLTVADTGPGIPPDVRDRIFEPFFTTKAAGQGTGLGLSTVYSIVQQLNGTIRLGRATGRGAVFEILLPPAADAWMPPRDDSGSGEFALTGVSPS